MGQHLAVFHFETGGLWVQGQVLGESWWVERQGFGMLVSLPSGLEDFRLDNPPGDEDFGSFNPLLGGRSLVSVGIQDADGVIAASVYAFQVAVVVESTVSSEDPRDADKSDGQRVLNEAFEVALTVAEDFLEWLRVTAGQFWLAASHEPPQTTGSADLLDIESGGRVPNIGYDQPLVLYAHGEETALSRDALIDVIACLGEGRKARSADLLLADSREALAGTGSENALAASRRDVRRAVLLAAIASEVKIKDTLREKTPAYRRELVDVVLKGWREVDIAIAELPHKAMRAAVGRSLHEEDPKLFDAVTKLFTLRNRIAHYGKEPTLSEARAAVAAAVRYPRGSTGFPHRRMIRQGLEATLRAAPSAHHG
jgi:hypothetical protein